MLRFLKAYLGQVCTDNFCKRHNLFLGTLLCIFVDFSTLNTVGGVMAFLTLHEMLPLAFDYAGQKQSVKAVFCGMAFMSARYKFIS